MGTGPSTVFEQQAQILTPHFAWEETRDQFLVGWVDVRTGAQRAIFATLVDKQGAPVGAPVKLVEVPEPSVVKNVFVGRASGIGLPGDVGGQPAAGGECLFADAADRCGLTSTWFS